MSDKLYGPNGSIWQRVKHIIRPGEKGVILRFNQDGNSYRNQGGNTWKLIRRGRDNWATDTKWSKRDG